MDFISIIEDSQGNINPYAVTGCKDSIDYSSLWKEKTHSNDIIDTLGMK